MSRDRLGPRLSASKVRDWLTRVAVDAEAWWFDFSRNVKTAGRAQLSSLTVAGRWQDGLDYIPAPARNIRRALRGLPLQDHSRFTFVDLGSGKGRTLFLAAEYPYRRIQGVEFAQEMHLQAQENLRTFRGWKQRCSRIESVHIDAGEFEFPEGNLVVYLFNPFLASVLRRVLGNLKASLDRAPREVFLLSVYPADLAPVFDSMPWLRIVQRTRRYYLYRAVADLPREGGMTPEPTELTR